MYDTYEYKALLSVTLIMEIMAKLIQILVSSLFVISCVENKPVLNDMEFFTGDSSVNQFILRDTTFLGQLDRLPDKIDDEYIGEFIGFSNATSSEYLLLVCENGGLNNQYNYFYLIDTIPIEYVNKMTVLRDSVFYTTLGVHIGSPEMDFRLKYKDVDFCIIQNATDKIYEFQDTISQYRSRYRFINGHLSHIEFGYVW